MRKPLLVLLALLSAPLLTGCPEEKEPSGTDASVFDAGQVDAGRADAGADDAGTPVPDAGEPGVDWCRLQWPTEARVAPGASVEVFGRVFIEGLTDRSPGCESDPRLVSEVGFGPKGSSPESGGWSWTRAAPNESWDGAAASEPSHDEHRGSFAAPGEGEHSFAFRFSGNGGQSWLLCDRNAGEGSDGSADGFQPQNAGVLTVATDPCEPNPCTEPPSPTCNEAGKRVTYATPGSCAPDGAAVACSYSEQIADCAQGEVCQEGACVPRTLRIDWCRLQAPLDHSEVAGSDIVSYGRLYVAGLTERTDHVDTDTAVVGEVGIGPDGTDPAAGGWTWRQATPNRSWSGAAAGEPNNDEYQATFHAPQNGAFDFAWRFSADSGTTWTYCDRDAGAGSDGSQDGYQIANAGALQAFADPCSPNPCGTPPDSECAPDGQLVVFDPNGACDLAPDGTAACTYRSTPVECPQGEVCQDGACGTPTVHVDWCRLQWPLDVPDQIEGATFTAYGHVFEAGLTDRSDGVDADALLVAQLGIGPDGSDPATATGWSWTTGEANPAWSASGANEAGNDEYQASAAAPAAGNYDFAWRFSLDGGTTWVYCDRAAGVGSDGSQDGYQAANAGALTTNPDPCASVSCDAPPASTCDADGVHRIVYAASGQCAVGSGLVTHCEYASESEDCGANGQVCDEGACVDPPQRAAWCRLQWPLEETIEESETLTSYVHLYVLGITDLTSGTDADPSVVAEHGIGADGTDPATDGSWSWVAGSANSGWNGANAGEPNNDEYMATRDSLLAGIYDHAWRVSADGGQTWTYCDRHAGSGSDGSEDGYQTNNAGSLSVIAP